MNSVLHSFDIAFPLELRNRKKPLRNGWITQGMFSKLMRFLNIIKKQPNLTKDAKMYIAKYKIIYETVQGKQEGGIVISIYCMQITNLKL